MKAVKKLTALLLSVVMLLGLVVIVPATTVTAAETTSTKQISLLDLSTVKVGASASNTDKGLPAGLNKIGVQRFNFESDTNTFFSGTQEVVELKGDDVGTDTDGKALKITFDKNSFQGNDLANSGNGLYSIKLAVPAGLGQYVTGFHIDSVDHTDTDNMRYRIGVISGTKFGTSNQAAYSKAQQTANFDMTGKYGLYMFDTFANATNSNYQPTTDRGWDAEQYPVDYVYYILTQNNSTDGGTGYVLLKDITLTVDAPASKFEMVEKTVNLLDLSGTHIGAETSGDADLLPEGIDEDVVERYNPQIYDGEGNPQYFTDPLSIVADGGENALKVEFNNLSLQQNNLYNARNVFSIKMKIPAGLGKYVKSIQPLATDHTNGRMRYRIGFYANGKYVSSNRYAYEASHVKSTFIINDTFKTYSNLGYATNAIAEDENGNAITPGPTIQIANDPVDYIYYFLTDFNVDSNAVSTQIADDGYVLLKGMKVVFNVPAYILEDLPLQKEVNLLDMHDVDETNDMKLYQYPSGGTEWQLPQFDFTENSEGDVIAGEVVPSLDNPRKVVKNNKNNKVLELNLNGIEQYTRLGEDGKNVTDRLNDPSGSGYTKIYALKFDIPTDQIPYITDLNLKMKKSNPDTRVIFEYGVTNGNRYSKISQNLNRAYSNGTNTFSYSAIPTKSKKVLENLVGHYIDEWDSHSYWGDGEYTGVFLTLSAYNEDKDAAGTIQIEEIGYTVTAPESVWNSFTISKTYDAFDLDNSDNYYPTGVTEWNINPWNDAQFKGEKTKPTNAKGKTTLTLDLGSTNITRNSTTITNNRLTEGEYSQIFAIKMEIPAEHLPYITNINLKLSKSNPSTHVVYEFGVTQGRYQTADLSKYHINNNRTFSTGTTEIEQHYSINELTRIPYNKFGGSIEQSSWDSYQVWDNSFYGIYFAVTGYNENPAEAGTLTIEEISYTCTDTIGDLRKEAQEELSAAVKGKSLYLQDSIATKIYVESKIFDSIENLAPYNKSNEDPYVVFNINGQDNIIKDYEIVQNKTMAKSDGESVTTDFCVFTFDNIAPYQMTDKITVTLYSPYIVGDETVTTTEYTIAEYCNQVFDTDDDKLKHLVADLLRYGDAAQDYMEYKTEELATTASNIDVLANYGTTEYKDETPPDSLYNNGANDDVLDISWEGATLDLKSGITMIFLIRTNNGSNIDGVTIQATDKEDNLYGTISSDDFIHYTGNYHLVYFSGYGPDKISDVIKLTAYDKNGEVISYVMNYSISSYASSKWNNNDPKLAKLVKMLMRYGASAQAYNNP